ncbi:DEAD/DEAH box helicase family protein [Parabacteroides goldsteinii]|uniref:DEAD/DEAH box helicase family protein n=1 Tax=Parabacteroides goldsteinii TaxID=328812 RepID=UPI0026384F56|nr:DEAD/DEAH box helicase family protein [Parabacteroides goldsteinii]
MELYDYQKKAVSQMKNGCILCGGVGSGKSRTALAYYFFQEGGELLGNVAGDNYLPMNDPPKDLYIITTARKRDTLEWEGELSPFLLSTKSEHNLYHNRVIVDSWNNIKKYSEVTDAFFIFDEQRVVGSGAWVKSFLKITKSNQWILLSATPGDTWQDYIPVFIANGFYRNRTEFTREHIVYSRFSKFPKVDRYLNVGRLIRQRNDILVNMDFKRTTVSHHEDVFVRYNIEKYKDVGRTRWNPYKDEPIVNAGELCYVWRKIVNTDQSRQVALLEIIEKHPRAIIFYNFDYELDILKNLAYGNDVEIAEWNGHCHQSVPDSKKWVYLVQYNAGAEGWNCIKTDTIIFYSQNYSYKIMKQSSGRIDRLNTPFKDLYYYHLKSRSGIDLAISRTLKEKKDFNATGYAKRYTFTPEALPKAA